MPEFILDHGSPEASRAFNALDSFTQGYVTALFFTDNAPNAADAATFLAQCESGENEGSFHRDATVADLAPGILARIAQDCTRFQSENTSLLEMAKTLQAGAPGLRYAREALNDERLGQLFWYARNGHGVTFMDDGDAACLRALQEAARKWSQVDTYLGDDGLIYF
jgi:hypothetical protein